MSDNGLTYGSLFSGIGGFDLGFDQAGMECAWQVEYDDKARAVLERHWPAVDRSVTDVREVTRDRLPAVDLICGGFPCQDVSVAGKRAGLAGERSGLWFEFHRIIAEFAPQWVVIENVPGLLSSNGGADFAVILRGLVECGYGVAWRVLDSQYFGVPQRRRRVFIVGSLGSGRAAEVLFERESGAGHPEAGKEAGEGPAGTLSARTNGGGFPGTDEAAQGYLTYAIRRAQTGSNGWGIQEDHVHTLDETGGDAIAYALNNRSNRLDAESQTFVSFTQEQEPKWDEGDIAPTLGTYNGRKAGVASFEGVRRLTPKECERLQGFPDGWTAGQADTPRYRQLGNAVTVNVAEWIGRRIMAVANE